MSTYPTIHTRWTMRLAAVSTSLLVMVGVVGAQQWSAPMTLVDGYGRLAVGNRLHVVGHTGGNLVHRSSQDDGATWSAPTVISHAGGNYPMQYGGLYAVGDSVYLVTAQGDVGPTSQHLDFRKSTDNGQAWSSPIQITGPGQEIRRANIAVSGASVHVFGGQSGAGGYGTGIYYFRSLDGGETWDPGVLLHANADASARMAVDGTTIHVSFGDKLAPNTFGGKTSYIRSADNGTMWSSPVEMGDTGRHARQQIVAADGNVFVMWQREALLQGDPLPPDRLGYNRSVDGGLTWLGPQLLPEDSGVNREHHQLWLTPGGGLHVSWSHGNPSDPASSTGYVFSPDYGATWFPREIALDTPGGNNPHGIVANEDWVHILAEPDAATYVRRTVNADPLGYCFGDGSEFRSCPCGNDGTAGHGCENSISTGGAILTSTGAPSIAADTFVLTSSGERPTALSIFLQGDLEITAVPYGDGLRCVGGSLKRLYTKNASAGAVTAPTGGDPSITTRSAATGDTIPPLGTRVYQVYYRDPDRSFCAAPTGSTFNVSNGLRVIWAP